MDNTSDKKPEDIGWSAEEVSLARSIGLNPLSNDANLQLIRYKMNHPGKPHAPLFLFRPFPNYVEEREIDLSALNNSDSYEDGKKPEPNIHTKIDDQVLLKLLTRRFNEWLEEGRRMEKNGESILAYSDVLDEMSKFARRHERPRTPDVNIWNRLRESQVRWWTSCWLSIRQQTACCQETLPAKEERRRERWRE